MFLAVAKMSSSDFTFPGVPIPIPDVMTITPVMCLPPGSGIIRSLEVSLAIFHSFDGDLDVSLTHIPSGTSIVLFNNVGGSNEGFLIRLGDTFGTSITTAPAEPGDGRERIRGAARRTGTPPPPGNAVPGVCSGRNLRFPVGA